MRTTVRALACAAILALCATAVSVGCAASGGSRVLQVPIEVTEDGTVLDLTGVTLTGPNAAGPPDTYTGTAIIVRADDVVVRGATIRGFKVGILAENCARLLVEDCDVSDNFAQRLRSTPAREDTTDWLRPHDNENNEWRERYGAGMYLDGCTDATVRRCFARRTQNGLLLVRSTGCEIYDNDLSFLSGWGLGMYRSSDNTVSRNSFDWCVRGYSRGVYHRGQDSAGILVFEQCSRNLFAYNSATHGGDGFFLYAGNETLRETGEGGSNDNIVYGNDFSHAVANGIEATFSRGNQFLYNVLDECDYGVWAGYSYDTTVVGNIITRSLTAGVAIEHGHDNVVDHNEFRDNRVGVRLWWDEDPDLTGGVYGRVRETASTRNAIRRNTFDGDEIAIALDRTSETEIRGNRFRGHDRVLTLSGDCPGLTFADNDVHDTTALVAAPGRTVTLGRTHTAEPTALGEGEISIRLADEPLALDAGVAPIFPSPDVPGERDAFLPDAVERGRHTMRIGQWGPLDPAARHIFPRTQRASGEALVHLVGPPGPFRVIEAGGPVTVTPESGHGPATLTVAAPAPGVHEFEVRVDWGGKEMVAGGTLLAAEWTVTWRRWTPAGAGRPPEDWQAVLDSPVLHTEVMSSLHLPWGAGAPADGVPADHFATVAETELHLPAGTWEVVTVSDDGVRVRVDGETVLENWTWHGPTEDRATFTVRPGGPHRIRVEHFEIDGWAHLALTLRRIDR